MKKEHEKDLFSLPEMLPLLPVRDIVVFPHMVLPLLVSREKSIKALEEALSKDRLIFLVAQKHVSEEDPSMKDLYRVGTVALVMRKDKDPCSGALQGYHQRDSPGFALHPREDRKH